ncbi:unnamed protein product [Phyllotreta striolata]|uniref:Major facilitator superfamily (MFS) profile domain-containing protein n=1 Tax=Phyllotreta striolata TaxID=444603 RepID=A0A9N9TGP3_PHYSR|nr:unnamed protein product [Phyllotreta striolata]
MEVVKVSSENGKDVKKEISKDKANFEEAITATEFGKFNIILLLFLLPSSFTQASEQMGISYVLPIAECDLQLTLEKKGLLNAVSFAGMISSGVFFGYLCDTFGRKKLIVAGYLLHTIFTIVAATSTNILQLLIAKFICGFIFNGPFSSVTTYLTEFHSTKYRSRVQLIRGVNLSSGFFVLAVIAWVVLPLNINFSIFGSINLHSWNVFLLCCSVPPLMTAIMFSFMPESPKFLMSIGKNEEALKVFQTVYSLNTGKSKEDFPIKQLIQEIKIDEKNNEKRSLKSSMSESWKRVNKLFKPPLVYRLIIIVTLANFLLMGSSIIKFWLPQLLKLINDYRKLEGNSGIDVCAAINTLNDIEQVVNKTCEAVDNSFVYQNAMIINGVEIFCFIISGFLVNCLGKKRMMGILSTLAAIAASSIYFAPDTTTLIALLTMFISSLDLSGVIGLTITLEAFPTNVRALALSLNLMFARIGAIIANMMFSYLVAAGCFVPFLVSTVLAGTLPILIYLSPNTENKDLL